MDLCDTTETRQNLSGKNGVNNSERAVEVLVKDLFSYDDIKRKQTIDYYYLPNATFSSPILKSEGTHNIKHIFLVWKTLNKIPPIVSNICFNGKTCVVFLDQILCPRVFPYVKIKLPVTVKLEFKETDEDSGLLKIEAHEEHWTVEGIINSIPIISFWYDRIIRIMLGKLLTVTGEAVYTATETASLLVQRSKEEAKKKREMNKIIQENNSNLLRIEDSC